MAYECILVAIDLSDEASEVLAAAQQQASYQESPVLHLVNVVKPLHHTHAALDVGTSAASAGLDKQLHDSAREAILGYAGDMGIPAQNTHIRTGNPAAEIKALADEVQADLIIIGTHGRHGLGLLLGSTANGVLHGAACDVLTVRIH